MFKAIRVISIAIAILFSIAGCQTAESIRYIHEPSSVFYEDLNMNHKEIKPFIDEGILIASSIVEADFEVYWIWLGFYTEKQTDSIKILKAKLVGNGLEKIIIIDEEFLIDENEKRDSQVFDLRTNGIKLIEINEEDLMKFVDKNNKMSIEVFYIIENDIEKMTFIIEKKVEKRIIYPT